GLAPPGEALVRVGAPGVRIALARLPPDITDIAADRRRRPGGIGPGGRPGEAQGGYRDGELVACRRLGRACGVHRGERLRGRLILGVGGRGPGFAGGNLAPTGRRTRTPGGYGSAGRG